MDAEEGFPRVALRGVRCDFGVECRWHAVERHAVFGGEDELLFEPEAFLERFNMREEGNDVGGDSVNGARGFKPLVLVALDPPLRLSYV